MEDGIYLVIVKDGQQYKLRMYKTAWSPVWNCFVGILRVYTDENGAPILECRLHPSNNVILFRASELTDYVL